MVYEFPPAAGGGVLRAASFAAHLRRLGWDLTVLCAEPVPGRPYDPSLLEQVEGVEVVRLAHKNLARAVASFTEPVKRLAPRRSEAPVGDDGMAAGGGSVKTATRSLPLSTRIPRALGFLDEAGLWARAAAKKGAALARERGFDVILASGPPFSTLAAAREVSGATGLPLVLDLRDPWAGNLGMAGMTSAQRARANWAEERALSGAASAVAVSEVIAEEVRRFGVERVEVIPNGFEPGVMPERVAPSDGPLRLVFLGRFSSTTIDASTVLEAMAGAADDEVAECRLEIAGPPAPWVLDAADRLRLGGRVRHHGYLPYRDALRLAAGADAGLVLIPDAPGSEGVYSSKLFDYMGLGLPVLLVGPEGCAAARLVQAARLGEVVRPGDVAGAARAITRFAEAKADGRALTEPDPDVVGRFDRAAQAEVLSRVLGEAAGSR